MAELLNEFVPSPFAEGVNFQWSRRAWRRCRVLRILRQAQGGWLAMLGFEGCLAPHSPVDSIAMNLTVDDDLLQGVEVSPAEALRDLAIGLFVDRRATLGQAARIAGVPQTEFQSWLADRDIPLHYDVEDFEADLKTLRGLGQL